MFGQKRERKMFIQRRVMEMHLLGGKIACLHKQCQYSGACVAQDNSTEAATPEIIVSGGEFKTF